MAEAAEAWTYGGVGGVEVAVDELESATVAMRDAARMLDAAARALAVAARLAGSGVATGMHDGPAARAVGLGEAAAASAAESGRLDDLAARAAAACAAYLDAEARVLARVREVGGARGVLTDLPGIADWARRAWAGVLVWTTPVGMAVPARVPGVADALLPRSAMPAITGLVNEPNTSAAMARLDDYDESARSLAEALARAEGLLEPESGELETIVDLEAELTAAARAGSAAAAAPALGQSANSLSSVMARLDAVEALGGAAVAIETREDASGRRHIVYIPGTQDWGVRDVNPADMEANARAVTGDPSDMSRLVVEAMEAHGIGRTEPVMLAGHSQGGIIATLLAATVGATTRGWLGGAPAAGAHAGPGAVAALGPPRPGTGDALAAPRFTVTHVVTAGSPTGRIAVPAAVQTLHLENSRDLVPGLDGRTNPAAANRTTVVHDRRASTRADAPDRSTTPGQAHALEGYAQTAALVDEGLTASSTAWRQGASPFLEPGPATLTAYRPAS
ncbi:hypothetical protein [Demequina pelophila]|uniref:hypothetical protein n=1 Tax=Demequina pelophila TaxID=1638984 RepID=UPI000781A5EF|nr:hypothetical protein [Demequina pelophila]